MEECLSLMVVEVNENVFLVHIVFIMFSLLLN